MDDLAKRVDVAIDRITENKVAIGTNLASLAAVSDRLDGVELKLDGIQAVVKRGFDLADLNTKALAIQVQKNSDALTTLVPENREN